MKKGRTLQELAMELERQNKAKKDYVLDTRNLRMHTQHDQIHLDIIKNRGEHTDITRFDVNNITHRQIGQHLGIPARYYDKMKEEYPELLAANVNAWFQRKPTKRMLRTLDGRARAFLSDRYRRIDNYEIAETVLPVIAEMKDARVESCELTESKMYLKVVNPRIETEVKPGDVVQAGILITNSEVGHGAVNVQPLIYRLVCKNGMVVNDAGHRRYHIGRSNNGDEDYELYRDETLMADDRAFLMKVQDIVRTAVDQTKFDRIVQRMREATEAKITNTDVAGVVELAAKDYGLTKDESNGVLTHLIQGGDLSLYGLANAVTRQSQDIDDYDRATELEAIGWDMMNMDRKSWNRLNAEEVG